MPRMRILRPLPHGKSTTPRFPLRQCKSPSSNFHPSPYSFLPPAPFSSSNSQFFFPFNSHISFSNRHSSRACVCACVCACVLVLQTGNLISVGHFFDSAIQLSSGEFREGKSFINGLKETCRALDETFALVIFVQILLFFLLFLSLRTLSLPKGSQHEHSEFK